MRLTEDARVFLVISLDSNAIAAAGCYARHRTPYIDLGTADETLLREMHPWLLPSPMPHLDTVARMLVEALAGSRTLEDSRIGVWIYDTPEHRRSADRSLLPLLEAAGANVVTTFTGLIGDGASAVLRFRSADADQIVIWDGGIAWVELAQAAEGQGYRPRWAIQSMLNPQVWIDGVPAQQRAGATGAGWVPSIDIADGQLPTTDRERWCLDTVAARTDHTWRTRASEHAGWALMTCQLVEIVRAALEQVPGAAPAASDVWSLVASLGERPETVTPPQHRFEPSRYDGGRRYALLGYDVACECFVYTSAWREIE